MKTSEVLDKAADLIQERGWNQGGLNGGWFPQPGSCGPVCIEGALSVAIGLTVPMHSHPAHGALVDYLTTTRPEHINRLTGRVIPWAWNDNPHTTLDEVIEVLRGAAAVERAKEESLEAVTA